MRVDALNAMYTQAQHDAQTYLRLITHEIALPEPNGILLAMYMGQLGKAVHAIANHALYLEAYYAEEK